MERQIFTVNLPKPVLGIPILPPMWDPNGDVCIWGGLILFAEAGSSRSRIIQEGEGDGGDTLKMSQQV